MISAIALLFAAAVIVVARRSRRWELRSKRVTARYSNSGKAFVGVQFYARKGFRRLVIRPGVAHFALDPAADDFDERLAEYRSKAKSVVASLNANERLLK